MTRYTFIRYDGTWHLWLRCVGFRLSILIGDYGSRADALAAAATIDRLAV